MIAIRFKRSVSSFFELLLVHCAGLRHFDQITINDEVWFELRLRQSKDFTQAFDALRRIKALRRKQILVDGIEHSWEDTLGFLDCYIKKVASKKGRKYCFGTEEDGDANIFGCRRSSDSGTLWCHGKYDRHADSWTYDKSSMREHLKEVLTPCSNCPAFDEVFVNKVVAALPNRVSRKDRDNFYFITLPFRSRNVKSYKLAEQTYVHGAELIGDEALKNISGRVEYDIPDDVLVMHVSHSILWS